MPKDELPFSKPKKRRRTSTLEERVESRRREALFERLRAGPCQACGEPKPCDPEHIKTRGSGGSDEEFNLWSACRFCHIEKGNKGIDFMMKKYWRFKTTLLFKGWYFCEVKQKWVHPESEC